MSKIRFSFVIILVSIVLMIIPVTAANQNFTSAGTVNASSDTHYFITIDPIGNHNVTDVFFINGTTNLPVGETLSLTSGGTWTPGGMTGSYFEDVVLVRSGEAGVNLWSCNLSTALWMTYGIHYSTQDIEKFWIGTYTVYVFSENYKTTYASSNDFAILPVDSGPAPDVLQTGIVKETTTVPLSPGPTTVSALPLPPTPSIPLSWVVPILAVTSGIFVWAIDRRLRV